MSFAFVETGAFGRSAWDDFGFPHNGGGDLLKTRGAIEALESWSPLQHIEKLEEPLKPVLILTSDTDERVEPDHAYDMTRALQQRFGDAPVYLWVEPEKGHTAPTEDKELAFVAKHFKINALRPIV